MPDEQRQADYGYEARRYKGPPLEELGLQYKGVGLLARGSVVISLILSVVLGGVFFYFHNEQMKAHINIVKWLRVQICFSLYDYQERVRLREAWKNDKNAIRQWCPEVD